MKNYIAIFLILLLILGVVIIGIYQYDVKKIAYINNQELFEKFDGTLDLQTKVDRLEKEKIASLDSIKRFYISEVTDKVKSQKGWKIYFSKKQELEEKNALAVEKYSAQIWDRLNQYVKEFGEEQQYYMLLGAKGDGGLMFASPAADITDELLKYANNEYDDQ